MRILALATVMATVSSFAVAGHHMNHDNMHNKNMHDGTHKHMHTKHHHYEKAYTMGNNLVVVNKNTASVRLFPLSSAVVAPNGVHTLDNGKTIRVMNGTIVAWKGGHSDDVRIGGNKTNKSDNWNKRY